ncbi:MAG: hypothetical protein JNL83_22520 [Myxococcales bacterium]|nr:hypothetical protein [Myxococcales bacterium]
MQYRRLWPLALVTACAQAGQSQPQGQVDAPPGTTPDAQIDAPMMGGEAGIDTPGPCTPMMVNLLQNGNFETQPLATGWTETRYQNEPIVRADGTIVAQSGTVRAWLGGVLGGIGAAATDALHQDVAVPASATNIVITGFYDVRTGETGTTQYDTASFAITSTGGAVLQQVQALSNAAPTTAWTAINVPVTANIAGQTVRLRLASSNDFTAATSFYFDTLALTATVCQ